VVKGTYIGAVTKENGTFIIKALPAGEYTLKVNAMGHHPREIEVIVADEEVELQIEVHKRGYSDAEAAKIPVGSNVSASSDDFQCEVKLGSDQFRVGDAPSFVARICNNSSESVYLIRFLDGSSEGRFPQVTITIEGPQGGFEMPPGLFRCAIMNSLCIEDFVFLEPGDTFEPFSGGFLPVEFQEGRFVLPGRYTATFIYSTESNDIRDYQGWPPNERLSQEIVEYISRVPCIKIQQGVDFDVLP
jgi:hypothetical protein